ncbi:MAG: methyltransferase domain-containing protein [Methylocystis sp.]
MFNKINRLFARKDPCPAPAHADPLVPAAAPPPYRLEHDSRVVAALGAEGFELSRRLEAAQSIGPAWFNGVLDALIQSTPYADQKVYMQFHRRRFFELFNHCAELIAGLENPMLLEFGVGEHTRLYKTFLRGASLHAADAGRYGIEGLGVDKSYVLDLTLQASRDAAQIPRRGFDLVLFTEVIEHLLVSPVELITWLLTLVKPNGHLLLTTPNMFAKANIPAFLAYENPLPPFPPEQDRATNSAHLREYSHIELLRFVEQAGGKSKALFFSACWDDDETLAPIERKNMVLVAAPGEAANDTQQCEI